MGKEIFVGHQVSNSGDKMVVARTSRAERNLSVFVCGLVEHSIGHIRETIRHQCTRHGTRQPTSMEAGEEISA